MQKSLTTAGPSSLQILSGGEMGRRIRQYDWSQTPLGSVDAWPQSLKTATNLVLQSPMPMVMLWGPDGIMIYNDGYSVFAGGRHPQLLGSKVVEGWPEVADFNQHVLDECLDGRTLSYSDAPLILHRRGTAEEATLDLAYSPIPDETGKPAGVLAVVVETTERVRNERALATLRELGTITFEEKSLDIIYRNVATALGKANRDFPFVMVYKLSNDGKTATVAASAGIDKPQDDFPALIDTSSPTDITADFCEAYRTNKVVVSEIKAPDETLPKGFWNKAPSQFIHLPVSGTGKSHPYAIISAALNPYRRFDGTYQQFCGLIAERVSVEINKMLALEEETKKAEALAEIDRAKTAFFTNISHEFRTPLTLMLGSLEEDLRRQNASPNLETAHRNALRLLRLVNNLLDFSRLEAGRVQAKFQRTDIAAYTADLASSFRSAVEAAGLRFTVDVKPVSQPVYVDGEMWEKIVFNLLSNAFKYTLNGGIAVSLAAEGDRVRFVVNDTGVGIPDAELPKMFQRFHRVQNSTGRTFEGTGIGLSLVKELVQLHGGEISVQSKAGKGSSFTVVIPVGKNHLPAKDVAEGKASFNATLADTFLEEARSLLSPERLLNNDSKNTAARKDTVLIADDNADMRIYVKSLLQNQYNVVTAANGKEALQKITDTQPALVVSDVMMPVMDGIALLKAIKDNPKTSTLPVILLSARAGEEAKVEGFDIGADDYLIKPFSAKELVARVSSQIALARKRSKALQEVYNLFDEVPFAVAVLKGKALVIDHINQYNLAIWQQPKEAVLGKPLFEARPDLKETAGPVHEEIYRTGKRVEAKEIAVNIITNGKEETRYFNAVIDPMRDEDGVVIGQLATSIEVTEQVVARQKIEENEAKYRGLFETMEQGFCLVEMLFDDKGKAYDYRFVETNPVFGQQTGLQNAQGKTARELVPDLEDHWFSIYGEVALTGKPARFTEGSEAMGRWFEVYAFRQGDEDSRFVAILFSDITERKQAEEALRESEQVFRQFSNNITNLAWMADSEGWIYWYNQRWYDYTGTNLEQMQGWGWQKVHHPDHVERITEFSKEAWTKPEPFELTFPLRRHDGVYQWFLTRGVPVVNEEGKIIRWIGTNTNINERVELAEKLEGLVEERTRALQRSNEDLQQFAHVASHDLKEPVRKVMLFINRLKEELGSNISEQTETYLSKIVSAASRMYAMIDGVLLYSSLNAAEMTAEAVDLNETLTNIENDLEVVIAQKGAVIERSHLPVIHGSGILLYQLFYNLVGNSLKFVKPDTKPLIQIEAKEAKALNGQRNVQINVRDNGIGFAQEDAERIFQTFSRLNPKDKFEGTGLGLALCKKIVERHGGDIHAESKPGEGASFLMRLPANGVKKQSF